ncbi:NADPH-dependent FMN reductase [Blastochloris viridis]|uniref:NADPH-dependent FMN reductase n=1 Tax=Blastochloris viridis TaxID=1079 RepID=A0A0H5BH17_BLAVI|nr:NAD(P)H-dependent oxidoreductase [Blastochloris viridis]ALK10369.1 NADPH-dependent FMN reductase [Blastochloris viridis]BAR99691.1 NADPH-dependent FMN reductase [Blastochloris viridis]CUU43031.1 putative flavoprotein [Blastochloris viridis]
MAPRLHIITTSTRPGRIGPSIAAWFHDAAKAHGGFEAVPVDLASFKLPVYDEPKHPATQIYEHDHTKAWSASVAAADAYVFVLPEYNFMPPPSFSNALDYVYKEWNYKPAGFVSYGGISGGLRSAQVAKLHLTTLKVVPVVEAVVVPMAWQQLGTDQVFTPNDIQNDAAKTLLDELLRWAEALKPLRAN